MKSKRKENEKKQKKGTKVKSGNECKIKYGTVGYGIVGTYSKYGKVIKGLNDRSLLRAVGRKNLKLFKRFKRAAYLKI